MRKEYMLTSPQYNVWIQEQSSGRPEVNTISVNMKMGRRLDLDLLEQAVNQVMEHNDGMRLRFTFDDGEVRQWVEPFTYRKLRRHRVGDDAALDAYLKERGLEPFSLYKEESLIDFELLEVGEDACCVNYRVHHIIIDGYSGGSICSQIIAAYLALRGEGPPVEWPDYSYTDFIEDELRYSQSPALIEDREYWKAALADFRPFRRIGSADRTDRNAGAIGRYYHTTDETLSGMVNAYCEQHKVSPYIVWMAAYAVYLAKVSDTQDVAIATARLNRDTEKERKTFGIFTTSVPVRMQLELCASFNEACQRAVVMNKEAAAHKKIGYSCILDHWKRAGGSGQLTDYTISFQQTRVAGGAIPYVTTQSPAGAAATSLALHVTDWDCKGRYDLIFDYRVADFRDGEMELLCRHLLMVLRHALEAPEAPLSAILLTDEKERAALLAAQWANSAEDSGDTILTLFQKAAQADPDKEILIAVDGSLTFAQLDERSDELCAALCAKGVRAGDIVAFLLPRDLELIPLMLGILKAGAAYLPLDYSFPPERIRFILEDCKAALMITKSGQAISDLPCPVLTTKELREAEAPCCDPVRVRPGDLCYVIYTSGTTGKPKGVMIEHRGIANISRPDNNPFNVDAVKRGKGIVAVGSICFDIAMFEIFVPLLNGIPVVLADAQQMSNPVELARLIEENGANMLHCTPSRLVSYMEEPAFAKVIGRVEMILSAGETLTKSFFHLLRSATRARVYNGYGPTEVTIGATVGLADDALGIGRPVKGAHVYTLDRNQNLLPVGVAGEIVVGGAGLARGYVNPALTAEKFIEFEGERVYRTGDLGYLNADGTLGYVGRLDEQVKLRGLRIELGEIEKCLSGLEAIEQAVVLVLERAGREHLCCFYTASRELEPDTLKKHAAAFLPAYMVPELSVRLDAMPMTVNGKVDKKALSELEFSIERSYAPPETELETLLCDVFGEVLELDTVGATDNFFEIGGTSLLAARVLMAARKRGVSIPFELLFRHSSPRELGKNLGAAPLSADADIAGYDYTAIHELLSSNRDYQPGGGSPMESVLLTGSTGYLGIHLLAELLTKHRCQIYCLVRPKSGFSTETRLRGALFYYFENSFSELFGQRLFVLEGDVVEPGIFREGQKVPRFDTVINCAANVAHFSHDGSIETVNTRGVKHLIDLCLSQNARLIQISTMSVGGFIPLETLREGVRLSERNLYVRQSVENAYLRSKFLAERAILQAAADRGLKTKIMRVGNLQGRMSDGEFQMNMKTNNFTRLLQSFVLSGKCSEGMTESQIDFSPVDYVATAIIHMCQTDERYTVFHVFGSNATIGDIIEALRGIGHPVEAVPDDKFSEFLDHLSETKEGQQLAEGFVARISQGSGLMETPCDIAFTKGALMDCGFVWPRITQDYLRANLNALDTLGFFEPDLK